MSALRLITGAAITTACATATFAGPAEAKLGGNAGSLIAYERAGDIHVMSDRGAAVFDVDLTASPAERDSAPAWGLPEDNCLQAVGQPVNIGGRRTLVYESRPTGADSDIVLASLIGYPPSIDATVNLTEAGTSDEGAPAVGNVTDSANPGVAIPAVVFTRGPVGQRDIWAKFLDNTHETQLTDAPGDEFSPDFSSDGRGVVYTTADATGRPQLAIVAVGYNSQGEHDSGLVDLEAPRFVTSGGAGRAFPSWRGTAVIPEPDQDPPSDSSRIVHVVAAFGTTYLDFIEAAAATTTGPLFAPASIPAPLLYQLTGDPGGDLSPSWHPHGDRVVFDSDRAQPGNRDIYRIEANGTNLERLSQDPAADDAPDWESIGFGCLNPEPYAPRPGTQTRGPRPTNSTTPVTAPGGGGGGGAAALRVGRLRVTTGGRGSRRYVVVRFVVNKPARGSVRLLRGRRTVARRLNQSLAAGSARIRVNLPRRVRGGRHRMRLTVTSGSARVTLQRSVRIRSVRSRR